MRYEFIANYIQTTFYNIFLLFVFEYSRNLENFFSKKAGNSYLKSEDRQRIKTDDRSSEYLAKRDI